MCWLGRDPYGWLSPTHGLPQDTPTIPQCPWECCPNFFSSVRLGAVTLAWGAVSVFNHPLGEKPFPNIQSNFPWHSSVPFPQVLSMVMRVTHLGERQQLERGYKLQSEKGLYASYGCCTGMCSETFPTKGIVTMPAQLVSPTQWQNQAGWLWRV